MKIGIFDGVTQENIVRDMTSDELADYEARSTEFIADKNAKAEAESQAKAAKAALLARLGITAEEAQLLLGGN